MDPVTTPTLAVPPLLLISLAVEGPQAIGHALQQAGPGVWASVVWQALGNTLFGYGVWTWLLSRHPANRVAPFSLGVPVVGLAAGMLVLGEAVTPWQWAGIACVVTALGCVMLGPRLGIK